jgi:6-pyruvoyltetrahydropterin/6-carboxytetrahydropterin synthase
MPTWKLEKDFPFEAAHRLPNHDGKCQRLHGHSWTATVVVEGSNLNPSGAKGGMVVDFGTLSKVVTPIVDEFLDHHFLNDTTGLTNPTSEEIARWLFDKLKPLLPELVGVEISETCTARCYYEP